MTVKHAIIALWCCAALVGAAAETNAVAPGVTPRPALPALSVRGVNYYPRETPWGGLWTKTPSRVWENDLALAASLRINTVRTFLSFSAEGEAAGLVQRDGAPTALYLDRLNTFLDLAQRKGIRVILCFDFDPHALASPDGVLHARRALSAVVGAHRDDSRVLMWDLMNEPDDDAKWTDGTRAYLRDALTSVRGLDVAQGTTIGMTWRLDRIQEVGLPDVLQYHEYCPKQILFEQGAVRVCQTIDHLRRASEGRPLLIGEFGMCTARDPVHGADPSLSAKLGVPPGSEADQARLYEIVLAAAERTRVAGVLAWCLYDYPIPNPDEAQFGLVRADGTLKPAAQVLKQAFIRWEAGHD